jgi:hypothetical protein
MQKIVLISGFWNLILGLGSLSSGLLKSENSTEIYFHCMVGVFLLFTSAVLIVASRDLQKYATFVLWEGLLRFAAAGILLTIGLSAIGDNAVFLGMTDTVWGIIYSIGLPFVLKKSFKQILFDQSV